MRPVWRSKNHGNSSSLWCCPAALVPIHDVLPHFLPAGTVTSPTTYTYVIQIYTATPKWDNYRQLRFTCSGFELLYLLCWGIYIYIEVLSTVKARFLTLRKEYSVELYEYLKKHKTIPKKITIHVAVTISNGWCKRSGLASNSWYHHPTLHPTVIAVGPRKNGSSKQVQVHVAWFQSCQVMSGSLVKIRDVPFKCFLGYVDMI